MCTDTHTQSRLLFVLFYVVAKAGQGLLCTHTHTQSSIYRPRDPCTIDNSIVCLLCCVCWLCSVIVIYMTLCNDV